MTLQRIVLAVLVLLAGCSDDRAQRRAIDVLREKGATVQVNVESNAFWIDLRRCSFDNEAKTQLSETPHVTSLFLGKQFNDADVAILDGLRTLENLDLSYSSAGTRTIGSLHTLPRLRFLGLNGLTITDADAEEIGRLRQLTAISLVDAKISAENVQRLKVANSGCMILTEPP